MNEDWKQQRCGFCGVKQVSLCLTRKVGTDSINTTTEQVGQTNTRNELKFYRNIYTGCSQKKVIKQLLHYKPLGRRSSGRSRRRWLDVSRRLTSSVLTEDDDKLVLHLRQQTCVRPHSTELYWLNMPAANMISFRMRCVGST
jgi:hypothetical protein